MNIIVACDKNFGIGKNGTLLTHLKEDLKYFKEKTNGKTIIMGRKTAESLPNKEPLINRRNIVLSRSKTLLPKGFERVSGLGSLLKRISQTNHEDVWVIGGGEIYRMLFPYCDDLYITEIEDIFEADTFFPNFKDKRQWVEVSRSKTIVENEIKYAFVHYKRKIDRRDCFVNNK